MRTFTKIDNKFYDIMNKLSLKAVAIYVAICKFYNHRTKKCWPSVKMLSFMTGVSKRRVADAINELEKNGLLYRQSNGYKGKSNLYSLSTDEQNVLYDETDMTSEQNVASPLFKMSTTSEQIEQTNYTNNKTNEQEQKEPLKRPYTEARQLHPEGHDFFANDNRHYWYYTANKEPHISLGSEKDRSRIAA